MALKKPLDLFGKKVEKNDLPVVESNSGLRQELSKIESLSQQIYQLQQELTQQVVKNDLESLVLSQISSMNGRFEYLQKEFKESNQEDILKFKVVVSEITDVINNLIENEIPKYKKQVTKNELRIDERFDSLKDIVEESILNIKNNLENFNNQLQENSSEVKRATDTYNKFSKIVESEVDTIKNKVSLEISNIKADVVIFEKHNKDTEKTIQEFSEQLSTISKIDEDIININEDISKLQNQYDSVSNQSIETKKDLEVVERYIQNHHQELVQLKEEVFTEIEQIPVGNLQENLYRLEKKIDYIKETYSCIEPEVIVKEVIKEGLLNIPPEEKTSDPLTPLDQNFVTLDQLQQHYRLFINRIQQQLSTLGGGGETQLKYLDDIVGIATNASAYDGKFLKYDHSIGKFVFATAGGGAGSQTLDDTLQLGNTSSLGMSVGVVTATYFVGDGSLLTNVSGSVTSGYATIAGIATYAFVAGVSTYASNAGISTYASTAGVSTYATSSGISTYSDNAGIATQATRLQNSRTFEITGDVVASAISFDGTGNVSLAATIQPNSVALGSDTTGDYVQSISGTSNQITVTGGTGESSTPILSLPSNLVLPQDVTVTRDLQVNRNLNVTGNITLGGTTAFINVQELVVTDPDIILGYRTDAFGNDVSNDNTANHGGVAIASTEGTPLVDLFIAGIETAPATYKKIMWFKEGTFAGLGTDAWLFNYAVGIGSTQFSTGTRLAAGNVQFTENDLAVVRNINASGVVTATSYNGSGTNLTGIVTSIVAGNNISISGSTGQVTINSTATGGATASIDLLEVMLFS